MNNELRIKYQEKNPEARGGVSGNAKCGPTKIASFTDLNTWKESHRLVVEIYAVTRRFPREEIFGLTNQLRRAAVSISSNIAEGFSRNSSKEKVQFYSIALGSLTEVQNQLLIARDVGYLSQETFFPFTERTLAVNKLIHGLMKGAHGIIHNS